VYSRRIGNFIVFFKTITGISLKPFNLFTITLTQKIGEYFYFYKCTTNWLFFLPFSSLLKNERKKEIDKTGFKPVFFADIKIITPKSWFPCLIGMIDQTNQN